MNFAYSLYTICRRALSTRSLLTVAIILFIFIGVSEVFKNYSSGGGV
jgi:hypothetical protein